MKYYIVEKLDSANPIECEYFTMSDRGDLMFYNDKEMFHIYASGYWTMCAEITKSDYDAYMSVAEQSEGGVH